MRDCSAVFEKIPSFGVLWNRSTAIYWYLTSATLTTSFPSQIIVAIPHQRQHTPYTPRKHSVRVTSFSRPWLMSNDSHCLSSWTHSSRVPNANTNTKQKHPPHKVSYYLYKQLLQIRKMTATFGTIPRSNNLTLAQDFLHRIICVQDFWKANKPQKVKILNQSYPHCAPVTLNANNICVFFDDGKKFKGDGWISVLFWTIPTRIPSLVQNHSFWWRKVRWWCRPGRCGLFGWA